VGSLCLTRLVENCPIVLQSQYTKFIWDNINNFIDKKNFNAKVELLNCLISLILGTENLFSPYANVTLYKVLDFLTDNDWLKRKLALNVIYTLIFYCKEQILPLKDHIINFLKVLKTDKVKEVREVCLLILRIFNENEPKKERKPENYSDFSTQKSIKEIKKENNEKKNKNEKKNQINNLRNKNNNIENNEEDEIKKKSFRNSEREKENERNFEDNEQKYEFKENNLNENIDNNNNRSRTPVGRKKSTGDEGNNNINNNINHNKFVNRKDDHTFVNEKMKIRPDPNKSIFKTSPNSAFFNKAKNSKNDIIVMAKGDPTKFNYNDEGDNIIRQSPSPLNTKKNAFLNKTQPNLKNKNYIDENNSITNNKILIKNKNDGNKSKYDYKEYKKMSDKDNDKDCNNELRTKYNKNKNIENKKINIQKRGINYINRNKQKENNKNNVGFADKNKKLDSVLINKLLSQMNNLSSKQLSLIDVMENIQTDAQQQIQSLNEKIFSLDSLVDELTSELNELRNENNY
jgi:hypothetical protein